LKNVIERAVLLSNAGELDLSLLQTASLHNKTAMPSRSISDHADPTHVIEDLPTWKSSRDGTSGMSSIKQVEESGAKAALANYWASNAQLFTVA